MIKGELYIQAKNKQNLTKKGEWWGFVTWENWKHEKINLS